MYYGSRIGGNFAIDVFEFFFVWLVVIILQERGGFNEWMNVSPGLGGSEILI